MKSFRFNQISLFSLNEHAARKISFNAETTIILGNNSTGKSSLIKSLVMPFGCNVRFAQQWKNADVNILLEFLIDGKDTFKILKMKYYTSLFKNDELICNFKRGSRSLGSELGNVFDFKLKLINREGQSVVPNSSFMFLPFYIDQDTGWTDFLNSFTDLGQFRRWIEPTIEYHTGLRPGEYYEHKGILEEIRIKIKEYERELSALKVAKHRMKENWQEIELGINVEQFQNEIDELLAEYSELKKTSDKYRTEIAELASQKEILVSQVAIAEHVRKEMEKDFEFATAHLSESKLSCPTCGAMYQNSFAQTFSIAEDEGRLDELSVRLRLELENIENKIHSKRLKDELTNGQIQKIDIMLSEKKGAIKLKDLIEAESRKEIDETFSVEIKTIEEDINGFLQKAQLAEKKLRSFDNKTRRKAIKEFFISRVSNYCDLLAVPGLNIKPSLVPGVPATGSEGPRSVLAFALAMLDAIREKGGTIKTPVIIDSPNQNAQDRPNLEKMIRLIMNKRETGGQLILGLEDVVNIDFKKEYKELEVIDLTEKRQLLRKDLFEEVYSVVRPYVETAINARMPRG